MLLKSKNVIYSFTTANFTTENKAHYLFDFRNVEIKYCKNNKIAVTFFFLLCNWWYISTKSRGQVLGKFRKSVFYFYLKKHFKFFHTCIYLQVTICTTGQYRLIASTKVSLFSIWYFLNIYFVNYNNLY